MKKYFALGAIVLFAGLFTMPVRAENTADHSKKMEEKMAEKTDKHLKNLTKQLSLSADQQSSVKTALETEKTKMTDLHKETGEKMKAIREDTQTQIKAVLTDDQKTKYDALLAEQKKNHKDHWMRKSDNKSKESK